MQLWKVGRYAQKMGIKTRLDLVPAISLGAAEVTPLEMTSVYATIANKGIYNEPISILKIEDKDGIIILSGIPGNPPPEPISSKEVCGGIIGAGAMESRKCFTAISKGSEMAVRLVFRDHFKSSVAWIPN